MPLSWTLPPLIKANTSKPAAQSQMSQFLWDRQEKMKALFERGDIDGVLQHYDAHLRFSDHALQARDLDIKEFEKLLRLTYSTTSSLQLETHGVNGTKQFSVWEWSLKMVAMCDDPIRGMVKGTEVVIRGCSLQWWKLREGGNEDVVCDWRVVREEDYACGSADM